VSICSPSNPLRAAYRAPPARPETTRGCFLLNHPREILPPRDNLDGRCAARDEKGGEMSPARLMHPDSAGSMANAMHVAEAVRDDRSSPSGKVQSPTLRLHGRDRTSVAIM